MGAIYLIRHGQASFGAADYDRLSDLGVRQSEALGLALRARVPSVATVWCGSMQRHRQTADACLRTFGQALPLQIDAGFDEYDHDQLIAVYEPRFADRATLGSELMRHDDPARAFQQIFAGAVARWIAGAHDDEYRESWPQFRRRVAEGLARLAGRLGKGETALVFTSGGPIATVAGECLGVPPDKQPQLAWTLANSGITKLLCRGDVVHLSTLNEHAHLEADGRRLVTYR